MILHLISIFSHLKRLEKMLQNSHKQHINMQRI